MTTIRSALQASTCFMAQFSLFLAASVTPLFASGQQAGDTPPPPATSQPGNLERLDESDVPAVTIPSGEQRQRITETRDRGNVTSIRVESGGSTYYIRPQPPGGNALPGDAQSRVTHPAQWQILQFEAGGSKDAPQPPQAAPVPPPPPMK